VRVAVIFDRFGPYHCARLEAAARHCDVTGIEVAAETQDYAWSKVQDTAGYARMTLFASGHTRTMSSKQVFGGVESALQGCRPDAVAIPGWSDNAALAALRWCADTGTPAILMSESAALDKPRAPWREWIKRRIVDLYSTALVGGQRHIDYLVQLGMPRDRIFTGYDVVDNEYFRQKVEEVRGPAFAGPRRGRQGLEIRQKYGLPENYFLASARFIEKKNLVRLIHAYAQYREAATAGVRPADLKGMQPTRPPLQGKAVVSGQSSVASGQKPPWDLVLLGDGPLREILNSQLSTLNLEHCVLLPGFKQYEELPPYYGLARAFVHASTTEQWGLVVNEAIASGLPVIVSSRCGCVPELVQDNGFTFDPNNEHELASRLFELASLPDDEYRRFEDASCRIAAKFGPERFGEGLKRAAELAVTIPRQILGAVDHVLLAIAMRRRR
jgi:1,2-diacylglycerol 3-alpha-glucosyltransferase